MPNLYFRLLNYLSRISKTKAQEEVKKIVVEVGKLIELPAGEGKPKEGDILVILGTDRT